MYDRIYEQKKIATNQMRNMANTNASFDIIQKCKKNAGGEGGAFVAEIWRALKFYLTQDHPSRRIWPNVLLERR